MKKPFRQFKDYGEIDTAAVASALTPSQAETGEAPVSNLPSYDLLLRHYAAACDALDYAHSEGFEWPHDPFGEVALAFADIDGARERFASGMSASGQDAQRLEAKPASPTVATSDVDAQPQSGVNRHG